MTKIDLDYYKAELSGIQKFLDKYYSSFLYRGWQILKLIHVYFVRHYEFSNYKKNIQKDKHSTLFSPLQKYLKRKIYKDIIIYPPTIEWNIPLIQRPQHLAKALAQRGYLFLYCTNNVFDRVMGYDEIYHNLILTNQYITVLSNVYRGWILFQASHSGYTIKDLRNWKLLGYKIIYEYIDEIDPKLVSNTQYRKIIHRHKAINDTVIDLAVVSSRRLYLDLKDKLNNDNIIYIPNGVEFDHFNVPAQSDTSDLDFIAKQEKPIIGYYGALANWIDYHLINTIAKLKPEWNFVLIGWDFDGSLSKLKNLNNIHYLGIKNYSKLPAYLAKFDVCMIPFMRGNIAKSTSPLKLFEYMSGGKQVVVTKDLEECKGYHGVYFASTPEEFVHNIDSALKRINEKTLTNILINQGLRNSWKTRALRFDRAIQAINKTTDHYKTTILSKKMLRYKTEFLKKYKLELEYTLDKIQKNKIYRIWKFITLQSNI